MVGTISVAESAKKSNFPLQPFFAFASAPSHVRIVDVPKQLGSWKITSVSVDITYPDGSQVTSPCTLIGGCWSTTFAGCDTLGKVVNGATIKADGIDENGNNVSGYVLGKGDVIVLSKDGSVMPEQEITYVHLLSSLGEDPREGDIYPEGDGYYIWQFGKANLLGVTSSQLSAKADLSSVEEIASELTTKADVSSVAAVVDGLSSKVDLTAFEQLSSSLSSKQDALTDAQLSAIDAVVGKRATVVTFVDGTVSSFNIAGEFSMTLIKKPDEAIAVKLGNGVISLAEGAFSQLLNLSSVELPNSLTGIGDYAFYDCRSLTDIVIPQDVIMIGYQAFFNCESIQYIVVKGKTQAQAESLLENSDVSQGSIITTWNNASQEWVEQQIGDINTALQEIVG